MRRPTLALFAIAGASLMLAAPAAWPVLAQPASGAAPAAVQPRDVAGRVAEQIEQVYFSPELGKSIADKLRAKAAAGDFDRYTDPRDLAVALTGWLKPHDAHFNVQYSRNPAAAPGPAGPNRNASPADRAAAGARQFAAAARGNFGFRKVEILPGNIGYIALDQFAPVDAAPEVRAAADAAMAFTANTDAMIFDLRDNGGGSPAMVGYLVSHFVEKDAKVYNTFKTRTQDGYEGPPFEPTGKRRLDVPVYILTSARTGSAAEAFPYTLQAAKRAVIVGETTGGAAHPGGPRDAGGGFSVFVSNGSPVNPITKTNWEGTGVIPDVAVPAPDALRKATALALGGFAKSQDEIARTEAAWLLEAMDAAPAAFALDGYAGAYSGRTLAVENGALVMRAGRRSAVLRPLAKDLFYQDGFPLRRIRFERDAAGKVVAMESFGPEGPGPRFARE
jgi:hypothetical protein